MNEAIDYDLQKKEDQELKAQDAYDEYCCEILDFLNELNAKFSDYDFDFKQTIQELL